ncbi:hypothetical protein HDU80_002557, partial [Chytriomyces hyalinus]
SSMGKKNKTDFFKLGKTMCDTMTLCRNLMKNSQVPSKIVIGGFKTSGFNVTTSVLIHAGGGLYIRDTISEVAVPVNMNHLWDIGAVACEMLRMKEIIGTTISNHNQL